MHTNDQQIYPNEPQRWAEPSVLKIQNAQAEGSGLRKSSSASTSPGGLQSLTRVFAGFACMGVLSVAGYYFASRFVAPTICVQDFSMVPTLHGGDRLPLNRWSYFRQPPRRGDLVVIKDGHHEAYAIKRVIAMPGESIYFKGGEVLINGAPLREEYVRSGTQAVPRTLQDTLLVMGKDRYFVLGDNRANLEACRFGPVHRREIIGSIAPEALASMSSAKEGDAHSTSN